jgi:peptidoglycan/xylan/chitin deacetylase (PgdA/CDA1 family)
MPPDNSFPWPSGAKCAVSLTFDDARASQVDNGLPVLDRLGVRGTFYVMSGRVAERKADWAAAVAKGHEAGNHSMRHPCSGNFTFSRGKALENYTLAQMEAELVEASDAIEQLLGVRPATFAYPCGQTFVGRGAGHTSYVPLVAKHFLVGRWFCNECSNDPAFMDLSLATSFAMDDIPFETFLKWVETARAEGRWLILTGHDVGMGHWQSVRGEVLEQICAYCQDEANGVWIDTVAKIGQHVKANQRN